MRELSKREIKEWKVIFTVGFILFIIVVASLVYIYTLPAEHFKKPYSVNEFTEVVNNNFNQEPLNCEPNHYLLKYQTGEQRCAKCGSGLYDNKREECKIKEDDLK